MKEVEVPGERDLPQGQDAWTPPASGWLRDIRASSESHKTVLHGVGSSPPLVIGTLTTVNPMPASLCAVTFPEYGP